MPSELLSWGLFLLFVVAMLILDIKVFQRREHEISIKEALAWTAFWIALALVFNIGVYVKMGSQSALEFLTGYLIEKSLSMDNLFVFIMIFAYFGIPPKYQHKVLFWGIIGALVMRALFILAGVALIQNLHYIIYVFGAFLVFIGIRMAFHQDEEVHPENNPVLKLFKRFMPVTGTLHNGRFFIKEAGKRVATPLFVVLLVIETTDVIFAVDSIPAILSITLDPFIVFTSNVFAILGLRALYFAVSGVMQLFHYLHHGLSLILVFVGVKMLVSDFYKMPIGLALGVVGGVLTISIVLSLLFPKAVKPIEESITQGKK